MRVIARVVLRVLTLLILAYRRWLSGRGPLRAIRCSFAGVESCSAYGLRAAGEAPTARAAIGRILRRLGRCRDACLLGDGRTLSWARLHDRPAAAIAAEMARDGERAPAIARMLATRRAVAIWRAELAAARALAAAAAPERPLVCSIAATEAQGRRTLAGFIALAAVAAFAIAFRPWLGSAALILALLAAVSAASTAALRGTRFAMHAALRERWAALRPQRRGHLRASAA